MERKALGRGLASLVPPPPTRDAEPPASEVPDRLNQIRLDSIEKNPLQPRHEFREEGLRELADSVRLHGILVPVIVSQKGEGYELVSGERRVRAARMAGLMEIPAVIKDVAPHERLELALIENIQREDLNPIEEAGAYQELIDRFSYTQEGVADRVGKDRSTVANLLRLMKLPTKVKQALQSGQISVGHARALAGIPEIDRQLYYCDMTISEGWSVRELETRIAAKRIIGLKAKIKDLRPLPHHLVQILDELRRRLGTQVRLIPSGKKGKIIIEYYSDEDLDRIYQFLVH